MIADKIKELGFKNAALAGISIGKDDFVIPAEKKKLFERNDIRL